MARSKVTRKNKLVRDGIPRKIRKNGEIAEVRILSRYKKIRQLLHKLVEESEEALKAKNMGDCVLELIDVGEALDELLREFSCTKKQFRALQAEKRRQVGGFRLGTFLISTRKA